MMLSLSTLHPDEDANSVSLIDYFIINFYNRNKTIIQAKVHSTASFSNTRVKT